MTDVFISYSRSDAAFVRWLHASLTDVGRDVWVDWEDIPPASEWEQDINDSIDGAESFIVIVTANSLASDYCAAELGHAEKRGKRIVPIALESADPATAPPYLRQLNWIWCRESDDREDVLRRLSSALDTDLAWARAHTRLLVRAVEWEKRKDASLLLRGRDLAEAERALAENAGKDPATTTLQQQYGHESRRAATRRQRIILGSVLGGLIISVVLGVLTLLSRNDAVRANNSASSLALTSVAREQPATHLDAGLLLGLAANRSSPTVQAKSSMLSALDAARSAGVHALVRVLHGPIESIAFAPDGRTLAAGNKDGSVVLWTVGTRKRRLLAGHHGAVQAVGLGQGLLAAGTADGTILLWEGASDRARVLSSGQPAINAIAVSPHGNRIAAGESGGAVLLWDSPKRKAHRLGNWQSISGLAFSPDGRTLAVSDPTAGAVQLLDTGTLASKGSFEPASNGTYGVAFSPDRRTAVTTGQDGTTLWNVRTHKQLGESMYGTNQQGALVAQPIFSSGGEMVASLGGHGELAVFDVRTRKLARSSLLPRPLNLDAQITTIAFNPLRNMIALAGSNGVVLLRDLQKGPGLRAQPARVVAFSPDDRTLAVGAAHDVRLQDFRSGTQRPLADVPGTLDAMTFGPKAKTLAVAYHTAADESPGRVALFDVMGRRPRRLLKPFDGYIQSIAFSADGNTLAVGLDIGMVVLADLRAGTRRALPPHRGFSESVIDQEQYVDHVAFSPDGRTLASMGDGTVALWDFRRRKWSVWSTHQGELDTVAFSPDGSTLATHSTRGRLRLWNLHTHALLASLNSPAPGGSTDAGVAFALDGRTIATAVGKGAVQLWSLHPLAPIGKPLSKGGRSISMVAFAPDGLTVATAGTRLTLWKDVLWSSYAQLQRRVCSMVIGNLDALEWRDLVPGLAFREPCPDPRESEGSP